MRFSVKKIFILFFLTLGVMGFCLIWPNIKPAEAKIVTSNFAGYDFARAVLGDANGIKMLVKPGIEVHDYEPTPQDIIMMQQSKLFIYNGGESEAWVDKILKDNNIPTEKTLRLMDYVDLKEEEEGEYDEHIWTSPENAILLVEAIRDKLVDKEFDGANQLFTNAHAYIERIKDIDENFRAVIAAAPRKTLIFGDRFPFRYFVDAYGLDYMAAFLGCSDQTEASSATIAALVNKAKETGAKAIFKIELTNGQLAQTIADESGAKVYELSAAHNISQDDFDKGITYVDIMEKNVDTLKEALY